MDRVSFLLFLPLFVLRFRERVTTHLVEQYLSISSFFRGVDQYRLDLSNTNGQHTHITTLRLEQRLEAVQRPAFTKGVLLVNLHHRIFPLQPPPYPLRQFVALDAHPPPFICRMAFSIDQDDHGFLVVRIGGKRLLTAGLFPLEYKHGDKRKIRACMVAG